MADNHMTEYQTFIHRSRYARWNDELQRREMWGETVDRYIDYVDASLATHNRYVMPRELKAELREAIFSHDILPSMRALMTAGPALERENVAGYNCSFIAADHPRAFDEALYILMNGTGVGFSVESHHVAKLPRVPDELESIDYVIEVADSKEGWAQAYQDLISFLYGGFIPSWDTTQVRPAGARLVTFGGRASGPEPLEELFEFTVNAFKKARGRRFRPIEAHGIFCKIGEVVVVGGVRRSALISLSDIDDTEMAISKSGEWWKKSPHFRLANNSAVYNEKPSREQFDKEWTNLQNSGSGERGIFSKYGAKAKAAAIGRLAELIEGVNPCAEILLRNNQFCNLTTTVIKPEDTEEDIARKVRLATILGTFQSTFTRFNYLRDIWRENTEEERLLGVSMTGIYGNQLLSGRAGLEELSLALKQFNAVARETNDQFADAIGINRSAAIACVKPEGTTSQLTGTSSGMNAWHDKFYVRNVRADKKDPLSEFLAVAGVPVADDVMAPDSTYVFSFPIQAPEGATTRDDLSAIETLELWAIYFESWCDHNPSVTINVRDEEWGEVREWVWENFDRICGISFLPYDGGNYQQAPYESCSEEKYESLMAAMPVVNWDDLSYFESYDTTKGSQEMACVAGSCELISV